VFLSAAVHDGSLDSSWYTQAGLADSFWKSHSGGEGDVLGELDGLFDGDVDGELLTDVEGEDDGEDDTDEEGEVDREDEGLVEREEDGEVEGEVEGLFDTEVEGEELGEVDGDVDGDEIGLAAEMESRCQIIPPEVLRVILPMSPVVSAS